MSLTTIGSEANILNNISRYNLEAFRAVNQAIGRVIRHKNDFGAVLVKQTLKLSPLFSCLCIFESINMIMSQIVSIRRLFNVF